MRTYAASLFLVSSLAIGCTAPLDQTASTGSADRAALSSHFVALTDETPEGLAVLGTRAFVASGSGVVSVVDLEAPGSEFHDFGRVSGISADSRILGMDFNWEEELFVTVRADDGHSGIFRLANLGGTAALFASDARMVSPNAIRLDGLGNFFVADAVYGGIFKVSPDAKVEAWASGDLLAGAPSTCEGENSGGASGMVVLDDAVIVANADRGTLVRVPILADGRSGDPAIVAGPDCANLAGATGLAAAPNGDFYVTSHAHGTIAHVAMAGGAKITEQARVDAAAGIATATIEGQRRLFVAAGGGLLELAP